MNWKNEVVENLRKYSNMASAAKTIPMELQCLAQEATSLRSARTGRAGGRNIRSHEDRLLNIMVKQHALEALLEHVECWLRLMDGSLNKLDSWERKILERLFIDDVTATQVAYEVGVERSGLYRQRDMILKKLALIMYGVQESDFL